MKRGHKSPKRSPRGPGSPKGDPFGYSGSWEGTRGAYGGHIRRVHGKKPNLTRCEKCGLKCYSLWLASHKCPDKCRKQYQTKSSKGDDRKGARRYGGGTCGTCGFKTSDLRSHVLLRHSNKEQYLEEHYNHTNKDGYNCHSCGKHFPAKNSLWKHISRMHGVVTIEEIRKVAMGKNVVEDKSLEKDQTMTELELVESNMFMSTPAAVVEVTFIQFTVKGIVHNFFLLSFKSHILDSDAK